MPRRSPAEKDSRDRLGPSCFSSSGFLGADIREWEEIVAADARILGHLGLERSLLVDALHTTWTLALQAMGEAVEIAPGVLATCLECRGRIPSPFPGEGTFAKHQVRVVDQASGQFFLLTELGLHLIEHHGFFQGYGSPFRIDPGRAAVMLGLCVEQGRR